MDKYYQVTKRGLQTTGKVGKLLWIDGYANQPVLEFPEGYTRKYNWDSIQFQRFEPPAREDLQQSKDAGHFIVVKKSGTHRPHKYHVHETRKQAVEEASRLAKDNPKEAFHVYELSARVQAKAVTTYELKVY